MFLFQRTWILVFLFFRFETQAYVSCPKKVNYGSCISHRLSCVVKDASDSSPAIEDTTSIIMNDATNQLDSKIPKRSVLSQLLNLLKPGEGQFQQIGREQGARRTFTDPQMWTHIFFIVSGFTAFRYRLYDLFILTLITTPLSLFYHYSYEKPGRLAKIEGMAAKSLFVYGSIQIFRAPNKYLVILECLLLFLTVVIFVITNLQPKLYEPYHCFMHVVPPIWITIVASTHTPLKKIF